MPKFRIELYLLLVLATSQLLAYQVPIDTITQEDVKKTVSFLASDEMAGRDTPSPELQKASEYVRDQFKSYGLKPAGDKESWFHTSQIASVKQPFEQIVFEANGKPMKHHGLFANGDDAVQIKGRPETFDPDDRKKKYSGIVFLDATKLNSNNNRRGSPLSAALRRIQINGGTAVIAKVKPNDSAISIATRNRGDTMVNTRRRISLPVIIVTDFAPDVDVKLNIPGPKFGTADVHNVIGMVPGSDPKFSDQAIIFSAHLDHIGVRARGEDKVFNGADDNATGVTTVLLLARAYAKMNPAPKRSVLFMTFWGEEKGLLGSRKYVERPSWPLEKIVANINIEMVGRPEGGANGKCWMTGWEFSDLGEQMAKGAESAGVEIFQHPRFSAMLYRASDNASFNRKGVIAHSFSAGSLHSDYHQVSDEWEKLDLPHMTKVIRGLFAGSLPIANGDVTPKKRGTWRNN